MKRSPFRGKICWIYSNKLSQITMKWKSELKFSAFDDKINKIKSEFSTKFDDAQNENITTRQKSNCKWSKITCIWKRMQTKVMPKWSKKMAAATRSTQELSYTGVLGCTQTTSIEGNGNSLDWSRIIFSYTRNNHGAHLVVHILQKCTCTLFANDCTLF